MWRQKGGGPNQSKDASQETNSLPRRANLTPLIRDERERRSAREPERAACKSVSKRMTWLRDVLVHVTVWKSFTFVASLAVKYAVNIRCLLDASNFYLRNCVFVGEGIETKTPCPLQQMWKWAASDVTGTYVPLEIQLYHDCCVTFYF